MNKEKKRARQIADRRSLLLNEDSPFTVIEAYKALRTNMIFSLPGSGCKCIAITSAVRSEGKSTNSINLAISLAQIGKKVLLIDADMRLPTIASMLEIENQSGLSNLVVGDAQFNDVCVRIKNDGIDVIPAGTIPPDPTRLLESTQMEQLLQVFQEYYDYILLDLPPVNTVTDALLLSKSVDGYLLLIKHNSTEHRAVNEMINRFKMVGGKILGFLYVDAEVERKGYYKKYGYGYSKQG